jgi:hypothetical protein
MVMLDYYPEDVPMGTTEELQTLIEQIKVEADPKAVVNIHLPAVTYEGDFVFSERTVNLFGSEENGAMTTIRGSMRIETRQPHFMELRNIAFEGNGGGTGLSAAAGIVVNGASFRGYDVGAVAEDGGWISLTGGKFEKNKVGLHLNSSDCTLRNPYISGCQFIGNEIGLFIEQIPRDMELFFPQCFFMDNETNIVNPDEVPLDLADADFR